MQQKRFIVLIERPSIFPARLYEFLCRKQVKKYRCCLLGDLVLLVWSMGVEKASCLRRKTWLLWMKELDHFRARRDINYGGIEGCFGATICSLSEHADFPGGSSPREPRLSQRSPTKRECDLCVWKANAPTKWRSLSRLTRILTAKVVRVVIWSESPDSVVVPVEGKTFFQAKQWQRGALSAGAGTHPRLVQNSTDWCTFESRKLGEKLKGLTRSI